MKVIWMDAGGMAHSTETNETGLQEIRASECCEYGFVRQSDGNIEMFEGACPDWMKPDLR